MKASQIKVGGHYTARVSQQFVTVRVDAIETVTKHRGTDYGGHSKYADVTVYAVTNLRTNKKLTFRSAQKFRSVAPGVGAQNGKPANDYPTMPSDPPEGPPAAGDDETTECDTCIGYGHFDEDGEPSIDKRNRKCLDCNGEGYITEVKKCSDPTTPTPTGRLTTGGTATDAAGHSCHSAQTSTAPPAAPLTPIQTTPTSSPSTSGGFAGRLATSTDTAPHLVVEARAGTGKTTTLIEGLKYVLGGTSSMTPSPQQRAVWDCMALSTGKARSICFVAFNRSIADELRDRVPRGVDAKTMHGLGFQAILKSFPGLRDRKLNDWRTADLLAEMAKTDRHTMRKQRAAFVVAVTELVGLCKCNLVDESRHDWREELAHVAREYDVNLAGVDFPEVADTVAAVLAVARDPMRGGMIGYDDMIWLPVVLDLPVWKNDLLLVDERQDLNVCQMKLALMAGKRIIAVGDEKQSIYSFAGADAQACATFKTMLHGTGRDVVELPLTVTRRCGRAIVQEARQYVRDFEAHSSCCAGQIKERHINHDSERGATCYRDDAQPGDMVLCRNNAPLVRECLAFIREGKRAGIRGRDVGAGLSALVERLKAETVADLIAKAGAWAKSESDKERAKQDTSDAVLSGITDKYDCIVALCDGLASTDLPAAVVRKLDTIFSDKHQDGVRMSSVHKAKGLEARRVFLLPLPKKKKDMPTEYVRTWQRDPSQEYNLLYVAITRAIEELVYVTN